jgi:hypothetical protein
MLPVERSAFIEALIDPRGEAPSGQDVAADLGGAQMAGRLRQGIVEFGNGVRGDQHPKPVEDHGVPHGTPRE